LRLNSAPTRDLRKARSFELRGLSLTALTAANAGTNDDDDDDDKPASARSSSYHASHSARLSERVTRTDNLDIRKH